MRRKIVSRSYKEEVPAPLKDQPSRRFKKQFNKRLRHKQKLNLGLYHGQKVEEIQKDLHEAIEDVLEKEI